MTGAFLVCDRQISGGIEQEFMAGLVRKRWRLWFGIRNDVSSIRTARTTRSPALAESHAGRIAMHEMASWDAAKAFSA
jgi:hypothetical protein